MPTYTVTAYMLDVIVSSTARDIYALQGCSHFNNHWLELRSQICLSHIHACRYLSRISVLFQDCLTVI